MKTKIISSIKVVVLALMLTLGLSFVYAWTGPTATPPNGNVAAPLNVGSVRQAKLGSLQVNTAVPGDTNGLDVFGITRLFGNVEVGTALAPSTVKIVDGNQGAGKVLTSDANGVAQWRDVGTSIPTDASLTTNGYQVFPSGLILQWGVISTNSTYNSSPITKSFPKVFPHAAFSITVTAGQKGNGAGNKQSQWGGKIISTSKFSYYAQYENPDTGPFPLYWMAVGW